MILQAFVKGTAKPQGSKRGFVTKTGRVAMVEMAGSPLKDWRQAVTWVIRGEAAKQKWELSQGPVNVKIEFYLRRPKKPRYAEPAVRPDVDKRTPSTNIISIVTHVRRNVTAFCIPLSQPSVRTH